MRALSGHKVSGIALVAALAGLGLANQTEAGFIGANASLSYQQPQGTDIVGPSSQVVSPAVEFGSFGLFGEAQVDIGDTTVLFTHINGLTGYNAPSEGFRLSFTGAPTILGVTLNSSTVAGFGQPQVQFGTDFIYFDFGSSVNPVSQGNSILLDVQFAPAAPNAVPLPLAGWAGLAMGSGLLGRRALRRA